MNKKDAIAILESRKLIAETGKFQLKVTSATPFQRPDGTMVSITNYAAMTPYHLEQAKELFKTEQFQEATNQSLSSSQRLDKDYVPAKGEIVDVVVDRIINKDGIEILAVVSVTALKTTKATNISFADEAAIVEAEQPALV